MELHRALSLTTQVLWFCYSQHWCLITHSDSPKCQGNIVTVFYGNKYSIITAAGQKKKMSLTKHCFGGEDRG